MIRQVRRVRVWIVGEANGIGSFLGAQLGARPEIEVLGRSYNHLDAMYRIPTLRPDVVIAEIGTQEREIAELLRWCAGKFVALVICADGQEAAQAQRAGARMAVVQPGEWDYFTGQDWVNHLVPRLLALGEEAAMLVRQRPTRHGSPAFTGIIAIGASTGGTEATCALLAALPPDMPGMVIVQHMPQGFTQMYAERLSRVTKHRVAEAGETQGLRAGDVYLAPGNRHMRVGRVGGGVQVECYDGAKVSGHCPSVNVLFHSVAQVMKQNAIGVLLTGMGADGAEGLLAMRRSGAYTIGQDQQSSTVYGMPKVAMEIGAVCAQAALSDIPDLILDRIYKS